MLRSVIPVSRCDPLAGGAPCELRACCAAGRPVGQIAVEAYDAEIDAPIDADHAGIFCDRIKDRVPRAVVDNRGTAAEAARNALRGPGQERCLFDVLDADNLQPRVPKPRFLDLEIADDAIERSRIIARRQRMVVARPGEPEILLQQIRSLRLRTGYANERQYQRETSDSG